MYPQVEFLPPVLVKMDQNLSETVSSNKTSPRPLIILLAGYYCHSTDRSNQHSDVLCHENPLAQALASSPVKWDWLFTSDKDVKGCLVPDSGVIGVPDT